MLVLSRKTQEAVRIRDRETGVEVTVTVSRIDGRVVRLGFDAPDRVEILRTELIVQDASPVASA
ncbi:carbon storage regulator [Planctomicrobium sp. SH527]|uniref:carbon storage regulator n=1 Tax=Planctomicrobium sp. SH527 TaxID=3448123 RepID=UPI003F5B6B6D